MFRRPLQDRPSEWLLSGGLGKSVLRLPVVHGAEAAFSVRLPCAACGLLQQRGDGGIGLHDFGYAAYGEVGGVGGVFVAFFAAEETPAAVVLEYRLFAVEEPYRIALVIHGAGGDAAVERVGEGLGKSVHVGCSQNKDGFYTIRLFSALSRHRGPVL